MSDISFRNRLIRVCTVCIYAILSEAMVHRILGHFCKCKSYSHFFSENISLHAIFNDQSLNDVN